MRRIVILLFVLLLAAVAWGGSTLAQETVDVRSSDARSDFPNGIVFTLSAASDAGFDEVRLVHKIAPDGVAASSVAECTGGNVVNCSFILTASRRNLIIPGAQITYFWRMTVNGEMQESEPQLVAYEDDRFDWRQVSDGNLTLWWYQGGEDEARTVLAAGRETLDEIGSLLQTTIDFPVRIIYYGSTQDMQAAIISDNVDGVVTLGEVVYSDTAMVSSDSSPDEIARHEVAHIVVRQALSGPYGVPDWLNEGTAVFAQTQPLANQSQALDLAIQRGEVFSVRSLSSASTGGQPGTVSLFYGQSWSLVDFLVETFGEEKFAQLFRAFKEGSVTGEALEQVYGFDQDGLENAWRESVGLPPREEPTPDTERVPSTPSSTSDPASTSTSDGGVSIGLIVAIAVLTVLLAGGLVVAGVVVARRYR